MSVTNDEISSRAKKYSAIKYILSICETASLLIILIIFVSTGMSKALAQWLTNFTANKYSILALYLLIASVGYYLINFPLTLYHSYMLEHKFSLSIQRIRSWLMDQFKTGVISYIISFILISTLYYILRNNPNTWWFIISLFWIFFSLVLARLAPLIIIPLFFKYKKLTDDVLKSRIMNLANKMQVPILDCFEIDFSKKTLKANACLAGFGTTRRVILADTLSEKYNYDEIEVILAHEFSHHKLKHITKLMLLSSFMTLASFYIIFRTSAYALNLFGLSSLSDIAALPVILAYFIIFGIFIQPFENYISRRLEKSADLLALKVTGLKEAFISTMEKLASQNLSDRNPHKIIKFFFFSHPPVDERIALAKLTK